MHVTATPADSAVRDTARELDVEQRRHRAVHLGVMLPELGVPADEAFKRRPMNRNAAEFPIRTPYMHPPVGFDVCAHLRSNAVLSRRAGAEWQVA